VRIDFVKMNGAANDFVMIDNLAGECRLSPDQISRLCDRRRGVGADGLIMLDGARGFDFYMRYHNADGYPAEMCGNGARCSAHFAASLGLGRRDGPRVRIQFQTGSGPIEASVELNRVSMTMMDARSLQLAVPVAFAPDGGVVHFMTVGTRHAVVPVADASALTADQVAEWGRALRNDPAFAPEGANVNFASVGSDGRVRLRTYEKGVEAETHACGTGSVAVAVFFAREGRLSSPARILQHSGDELVATFELASDGARRVVLEGPVAVNFHGSADV
jgi:diaminopimelate epimerase